QIAKGTTTFCYLVFLLLTIPMSIWCSTKLHRFPAYNKQARHQEISQTLYAISSSFCHGLKGAQQCYWMYANIRSDTALISQIAGYYNSVNTIALFSPPILLLLTSSPTRKAILSKIPFLGIKEEIRTNIIDVGDKIRTVSTTSGISVSVF
ncbi:hypothetical protein PENTCL1PPCAC_26736, partial [Pristionchus entomophagus]